MRKWGLHYLISLLVLAVILSGCGAGNDNNAADDTSLAESLTDGKTANSAPAAAQVESELTESAAEAGGGQDQKADANQTGTAKDPGTVQAGGETAGFTASDVAAGLNKKLIYRANLVMEVKDYGAAQSKVRNLASLAGGYIIEFSESVTDYEKGGNFILKVPASGFSSLLDNLEKIENENIQQNIKGQDVSEEYVDLESRLKAQQLMESQYIEFMKKATKSADLVAFANQLGAIQEKIEQIKGRMRYIDQNVAYSTIELRLYQTADKNDVIIKDKDQGPLMERASDALKGSLNALSVMFQWLIIFLAGAFPVLIVCAVIAAVVLWLRRKINRGAGTQFEQIRKINREQNREMLDRVKTGQQPETKPDVQDIGSEPENKEDHKE